MSRIAEAQTRHEMHRPVSDTYQALSVSFVTSLVY
jgi:hypothetical protein